MKKQGQVQAMWIGRKTKVPAWLGFEDNCCNCTWKGTLAPAPTERVPLWLSRCFVVLLCCCFDGVAVGTCDTWERSFLTEITSNVSRSRMCGTRLLLINKTLFNVVLKIKKQAVWWRIHKLVHANLEKLWSVVFFVFSTCEAVAGMTWHYQRRAQLPLMLGRVHAQWLSDVTEKFIKVRARPRQLSFSTVESEVMVLQVSVVSHTHTQRATH